MKNQHLDIVPVELMIESFYYPIKMNFNSPLPESTPNPEFFYMSYIYRCRHQSIDWSSIVTDLGCEYMVRLMLLDSSRNSEVYEFSTKINKLSNIPSQIIYSNFASP